MDLSHAIESNDIPLITQLISEYEPNKKYNFDRFLARYESGCQISYCSPLTISKSNINSILAWSYRHENSTVLKATKDIVNFWNYDITDQGMVPRNSRSILEASMIDTNFEVYNLSLLEYKKYISEVKTILKYLGLENICGILRLVMEPEYPDVSLTNEIYR